MGPDSGRTSFRDGMDSGGQVFKTVGVLVGKI
jgi:hypothetical protein